MSFLSFIFNLPYTLIGSVVAIVSVPKKIEIRRNPFAIIITTGRLWWAMGYMKGARAVAMGNVVILGNKVEAKDLEHEMIHVQQHIKFPLIFPILYYTELLFHGYKNNRFEVEAYEKAGNEYRSK